MFPAEELVKLGIAESVRGELYVLTMPKTTLFQFLFNSKVTCAIIVNFFFAEVDLQHSAIWMAGVYLMLLMQFLENKVAIELTRSEFVEAQEVGIFPPLLL